MTQTITIPRNKKLIQLTTISLSQKIAAPVKQVWEVISTPGHLAYCHPFCDKNPVENWSGVGSQDTVYFYSGKLLNRYAKEWIKDVGYDLHLTFPNLDTEAEAIFRISPCPEKTNSILSITLIINVPQYFPWYFRLILSYFIMRPSLTKYLDSVLKGFEYYITTRKAVERNQFGSHSFFSYEG